MAYPKEPFTEKFQELYLQSWNSTGKASATQLKSTREGSGKASATQLKSTREGSGKASATQLKSTREGSGKASGTQLKSTREGTGKASGTLPFLFLWQIRLNCRKMRKSCPTGP
jgi:hypothetical protein